MEATQRRTQEEEAGLRVGGLEQDRRRDRDGGPKTSGERPQPAEDNRGGGAFPTPGIVLVTKKSLVV